jgi:SAM-dependent methyltransferase
MKPYLTKLINMKLLDHEHGVALEVGAGEGKDASDIRSLGYTVMEFDKTSGTDLRTYDYGCDRFDFINVNNVLPFVQDKEEVKVTLQKMTQALKKGGILHFTLFGENDPWISRPEMSFWSFHESNDFVDTLDLKCILRCSEEYMGKTMAGEDKYWHILRFVLVRK